MKKKPNNFVKKHMDQLHKPRTHVDKKKRDSAKKCRKVLTTKEYLELIKRWEE